MGLILYSKNYPSKFSISIVGKVTIRIAYPNTRLSSKFPKVKDLETFRWGIGIYLSLAIGIFPKEGCNLEPPTKNKSEIIFLLPQQCPDRGSKQTFLLCVHISYFWKSKVHVSALALFIFPFFDKNIILSSVALFVQGFSAMLQYSFKFCLQVWHLKNTQGDASTKFWQ